MAAGKNRPSKKKKVEAVEVKKPDPANDEISFLCASGGAMEEDVPFALPEIDCSEAGQLELAQLQKMETDEVMSNMDNMEEMMEVVNHKICDGHMYLKVETWSQKKGCKKSRKPKKNSTSSVLAPLEAVYKDCPTWVENYFSRSKNMALAGMVLEQLKGQDGKWIKDCTPRQKFKYHHRTVLQEVAEKYDQEKKVAAAAALTAISQVSSV